MAHALRIHQFGGPEVLQWGEIEVGVPAPREVRVRQTAIGVNFADVYMRTGNHHALPALPAVLGIEAAGVVEELGSEVREFAVGERVAYFGVMGAYTEARLVPADRLMKIPADVDDNVAAALLTKGITAQYLIRQVYPVKAGDKVLIHAVAGGVGLILSQWAAALGATVIGTVSSDEKAEIAKANGCQYPIVSSREDFVARVAAITAGEKVAAVFDALGKDTALKSLDCLRPRGILICFGRTTGFPGQLNIVDLMYKGSLIVTMPQLRDFAATREQFSASAADLFAQIKSGKIKANIRQKYALKDGPQAHRDLEARKTAGSVILTV